MLLQEKICFRLSKTLLVTANPAYKFNYYGSAATSATLQSFRNALKQ